MTKMKTSREDEAVQKPEVSQSAGDKLTTSTV